MSAALALVVGLAAAQSPMPAVPELKLEGSADGSASLSVSAGVQVDLPGVVPDKTLVVRGTYDASTSKGLAQILSVTNDGKGGLSGTWQIGLAATLIGRAVPQPDATSAELHPNYIVNAGFELGKDQVTYLEDTGAGLELRDVGMLSGHAGASAVLRAGTLTIEGLANYSVDYQESGVTTHWCTDTGNVITGPDTTAPSQSCSDTALGAAEKSVTWHLALQVGRIDPLQDKFRVAGRVDLSIGLDGAGAVTVSAPAYYRLLGESGANAYKGIVQVSPYMRGELGPSGSWSLGLTLSLLAQDKMFSKKFDTL